MVKTRGRSSKCGFNRHFLGVTTRVQLEPGEDSEFHARYFALKVTMGAG